jgi:hypothetical protein
MESGLHGFTVERVGSLPPGCTADVVTADGHILAFCHGEDGRLRFLWDGVAGQPFDGLGELRDKSPAVFVSDDGAHVAYMALRGETAFVGRDDDEEAPFESLSRSVLPAFDHRGRHLAYGAQVNAHEHRLIVDGEPRGGMLAPIGAVFSVDGERLAFRVTRAAS